MRNFFPPLFQRNILVFGVKSHPPHVIIFVIVTILASATSALIPVIIAKAIAQASELSAEALFGHFAFVAVCMALSRVMQDFRLVLMNSLEQKIRLSANKVLFKTVIDSDLQVFNQSNSAKISNLVQSFHSSNKTYVQLYLMVIIGGISDVFSALFVLLTYGNIYVSILALIFGLGNLFITYIGNNAGGQYIKRATAHNNDGANFLGNVLHSIISIKIYARENWVSRLYSDHAKLSNNEWSLFYRVIPT